MKNLPAIAGVFLLCTAIVSSSGCRSDTALQADRDAIISEALCHSRLFAHVRKVSNRAFFMLEDEQSGYFEVSVGASTPERFERLGTLRISKKDHTVSREAYDTDGEVIWVDDTVHAR